MKICGRCINLYSPPRWDWPWNERWLVAVRFYHIGFGIVRAIWGYRILLGRWQVCIHTEVEK